MRFRLSRTIVGITLPLLAFGVLGGGCNPPSSEPDPYRAYNQEEEERPPVIITSGGSIKAEAQEAWSSAGTSDGRGSFDAISGNAFKHTHNHKPTNYFEIVLVFAQCVADGKPYNRQPFKTDALTVNYSYSSGGMGKLVVDVYKETGGKSFLRLDGPGFTQTTPYRLVYQQGDDAAALTSAQFKEQRGNKDVTCTFTSNERSTSLVVFQKK